MKITHLEYDWNNNAKPVFSWCNDIEENALEQIRNLSRHPVVYNHIAVMPDCHIGYGMPIGGVISCENALIPNAVGVDIGCGMLVKKTTLRNVDIEDIKKVMGEIRESVPVGREWHKTPIENNLIMPCKINKIMGQEEGNIDYQLGTLGGGNHFIEIQKDKYDNIWFMIHTGSRNFGKKVCDHYNELAIKRNVMWHSNVDPKWNLAFLPIGTPEAGAYIEEMKFALEFAKENRRLIANAVENAFIEVFEDVRFYLECDVHHNYAALENHYGKNVWVHRKGAVRAREGDVVIVPGSMGTSSYIGKGLGNPKSFNSCSHGAGRVMSRSEASRVLTEGECNEAMKGIVFGRWGNDRKGNKDFGEAPQAYKNIDEVICAESDLMKPIIKLTPIGVIKG